MVFELHVIAFENKMKKYKTALKVKGQGHMSPTFNHF